MFRHSCGICHFCNTTRPSDITLADFWGWQKIDNEINADDKGVSLVIINTEKGKEIWDKISIKMNTKKVAISDCLQPNLIKPTSINSNRMVFEYLYKWFGFKMIAVLFLNNGFSGRLLYVIKKICRRLYYVKYSAS